jgi:hypothetical protein
VEDVVEDLLLLRVEDAVEDTVEDAVEKDIVEETVDAVLHLEEEQI